MNSVNRKIIDAVIARAERICPDSLELIGVYGSVATGDEYAGSDLDLLILIGDDDGFKLAECMILEDIGVGYDLYCTRMEWLRCEAECRTAQLSRLMDSRIVYVKNQQAYNELLELREQAKAFLQSEERFERVEEQIKQAKLYYAEACLSDKLSRVRMNAAGVVLSLLSAVMLYHGCYFKRGSKRTFEELAQLPLDERFIADLHAIPLSKETGELCSLMKALINYVRAYTSQTKEKAQPSGDNICGTYEEMYSNWRNKTEEAAGKNDAYSSFMNMCFLQNMIDEISNAADIGSFDVVAEYNPDCLRDNVLVFDRFLADYEAVYGRAGIAVRRFADVDEFCKSYTQAE